MPIQLRFRNIALRRPAAQYVFALLILLVSTWIRILLNPALGDRLPYVLYFAAVAVVSMTCDVYPALVELVVSAILANVLFLMPPHQFTFSRALLFGGLYLISGYVIIYAGQAHRRSAKALQEQKDWLSTTLSSIGDAVIATDADGLITLMNPVAEKLTGWSFKEAWRRPITEVFRIFNQDSRQSVESPIEKVRRLNRVAGLANHTILVSKSGEEIAIDDSGAPIFAVDGALKGIVLVFRDVTAKRKTQKAAAELAAIVQYSGDAIATKNLDGFIQTWNGAAEQLFGYKQEEIIGKPVTVLIPPDRLDEETEILRRIREGRPSERLETIRVRKDGRQVHVSVCVSPIKDADGHVIGASKVVHDITVLAAAREELVREKEFLATTIASIGDAVIATDAEGRVLLMNRISEALTGWTLAEARSKPLAEVFRIVNQETRQTVENPVDKVRRLNKVVGLANHTILIARNGVEIAIDDSGAPIFAPDGTVIGIVLVFRDVTEARKADARLTAQAALLDLAWDAIIVRDESGSIKFWNRGAEELYGWSRKEALGRTTHELIRTEFPVPLAEIVRETREKNRWQGELVHTAKSGRRITVLSRWGLLPAKDTSALPDLMETNTDITGRKQDEEQIRKQREWFHTTLTSIGDAVITTDPDGLITLMNPIAEKLTEWNSEEAVGKPLTDVFRIVNQETGKAVENPVEKVRRLKHVVGLANHTVLISKSGQEIAIDDSGAPIQDSNGELAGIVLIFRDVTQERALEIALKSNERLALAGRLSASIAHEIHNPLDTVGNALFLLNQQVATDPNSRQLIETAQREVQRVAEISKNMLSLHRESRRASRVKLSALLEGVVALIKETIAKDRRKIELLHGFEGEVVAFPSELRQVFTNVIKNAVEATADGGNIRIYSEAAQQPGQTGVVVRIVDDGVGIPEQLQSRLFSPFVSTKEESGTGLGLWVSQNILGKHGGSMKLESPTGANNRGTTVSIFLPLKLGAEETEQIV